MKKIDIYQFAQSSQPSVSCIKELVLKYSSAENTEEGK
jgi:hypothetical protein